MSAENLSRKGQRSCKARQFLVDGIMKCEMFINMNSFISVNKKIVKEK